MSEQPMADPQEVERLTAHINRLERGLAWMYRQWPANTALCCDEIIDRSGATLGRIRALARLKEDLAT